LLKQREAAMKDFDEKAAKLGIRRTVLASRTL
jgi:hypothetical protein